MNAYSPFANQDTGTAQPADSAVRTDTPSPPPTSQAPSPIAPPRHRRRQIQQEEPPNDRQPQPVIVAPRRGRHITEQHLPNVAALHELLQQEEQEIEHLSSVYLLDDDDDDDEDDTTGILWDWVKSEGDFTRLTNFSEEQVLDFYRHSKKWISQNRRRGPHPGISYPDAWIAILAFYKFNTDYTNLSRTLRIRETTLQDTIKRMRTIVFLTLEERWWCSRLRPQALDDPAYSHIALLVDTTSIQVYRPRGLFDEVKPYWDTKNKIYALKKEVLVLAHAPYYAMFSGKKRIGSTHDYLIHKDNYLSYSDYLLKTADEQNTLTHDRNNAKWVVLGDKAYQGPDTDTPEIHRMFVRRAPRTARDREQNAVLSRIRVPVEQFFGRLTKLWKILRGIYRYDHSHFDTDFDNCVLLTNEHIRNHELVEIDRLFYRALISERKRLHEQREEKQKASVSKYREKKRRLAGW